MRESNKKFLPFAAPPFLASFLLYFSFVALSFSISTATQNALCQRHGACATNRKNPFERQRRKVKTRSLAMFCAFVRKQCGLLQNAKSRLSRRAAVLTSRLLVKQEKCDFAFHASCFPRARSSAPCGERFVCRYDCDACRCQRERRVTDAPRSISGTWTVQGFCAALLVRTRLLLCTAPHRLDRALLASHAHERSR